MITSAINASLQRRLEEGRSRAASTDLEHARLWDALIAAAEGGKRFRPVLVLAIHDALDGQSSAAAVEVGVAIELLHTAFVIHDDVIDGDDRRRGRLNVSGTFRAHAAGAGADADGAKALGRTAGILAGDLALAAAIRAVAMCGASVEVTHRLLDLFDSALHTTAAGELADVRLSLDLEAPTLEESLAMEEQKTGAYSFSLPLQAGAMLAGADRKTVDMLGEVGRTLGIAFQLADDLLGVFGDPAQTGKSATSDLRTRKQTPLLTHARSTPEWRWIHSYVGRELSDEELTEVRRLLTVSGSRRFIDDLVVEHLTAAQTLIEDGGLSPDLLTTVTASFSSLSSGTDAAA